MQDDVLFGSGYEPELWPRIGAMLLGQSPILLAYIGAIVVALVFIGKRTKPALLVAIATGLLLFWSILHTVLYQLVLDQMYRGEIYPDEDPAWFVTLEIGWIVVRLVSLALFVIAALGWRSAKQADAVTPAQATGMTGAAPIAAAVGAPTSDAPVGHGPVTHISKGLFITLIFGSSILAWVMLIPAYAIIIAQNEDLIFVSLGLSCTAYILGILATVMGCILVFKLWATIRDGPARTTPGKAVGFLFIPFFNFYWLFVANWGWAVDFNRYTEHRGIQAKRAHQGIALTACILGVVPYVNILTSPVTMVLMWVHLSRAIDGANAVRALRRAHGLDEQPPFIPAH